MGTVTFLKKVVFKRCRATFQKSDRPHTEAGAVLILVALLASVLILMVGLAIDTAIIARSQTQQQHAAEYMALGSLKTFFKSTDPDIRNRLNEASDRAELIAQQNEFLGKNLLVQQSQEAIGSNIDTEGTDHGLITPGKWYFKDGLEDFCNEHPDNQSAGARPCPCDSLDPTAWNTPCFRELDFTKTADRAIEPNAFEVILKTSADSPLRTLFARVAGNKTIALSSTATAVKIARRGVIMLDLSSSSHSETHIPYSTAAALRESGANHPFLGVSITTQDAGEYVFIRQRADVSVNPSLGCNPAFNRNNPCYSSVNFQPFVNQSCYFEEGYSSVGGAQSDFDIYDTIYNLVITSFFGSNIFEKMFTPVDRFGTPSASHLHFQSDYACFENIEFQDTLPDGTTLPRGDSRYPQPLQVLVDTYTDDSDPNQIYDGPEPLTTMLDAVNEATRLFETNFLPGDELTVIGFDSSANIDIRKIGPIKAATITAMQSNPILAELKTLSDISIANQQGNPLHHQLRIKDHLFIPRLDPHLNIPEALEVARDELLASGTDTAEYFVAVISDGVSTCYNDSDTNCLSDDGGSTPLEKRYCRNCDASFNGFQNSLNAAETIIKEKYIPDNIKFHFIHIGSNTGPHSLLRVEEGADGTKTCMTDVSAGLQNPPLGITDSTQAAGVTDEDSFKGVAYNQTFHAPAKWSPLVRKTNGLWLPVSPPCELNGSGEPIDLSDQLEIACGNASGGNGSVVADLNTNGGNPITDDKGRITCNPYGTTRREQIKERIAQIYNIDPYILVK